ncbi:MAG: restriction endonuclease [Veillonellaceae bacterium]|nr:MAG: restriction endonuclease [Veillonellaceae bacterium]
MMQSLNEKTWVAVQVDSFADVMSGKDIYASERVDGERPYVTAGTANNGIGYFVGNDNNSVDSHVISVNRNGAVGEAFFHPYKALFGNDCRRLKVRESVTDDAQQFMAVAIKEQKGAFSYSRKLGTGRLQRLSVMLPVTDSGEPDYAYMAEYVQQKRNAMLAKYRTYVEARIAELGEIAEIPALDEKEWKHFYIPDIFSKIQRGKRLKNADHIPGKIPYVSSTANNNGVDDYVEISHGARVFKNCISLANSGSVGTAFYEPFSFVASDHITSLKMENGSKFVYLFLVAIIEKQSSNFNFNREINDSRIKKMQVMLPVNDSGKPDYAYMEQYAKNMMLRKYRQYLAYLDRQKQWQE